MGRELGWQGKREEIGQIRGWQSSFLSRMSVDGIPRSSCERLLISIKPDWIWAETVQGKPGPLDCLLNGRLVSHRLASTPEDRDRRV